VSPLPISFSFANCHVNFYFVAQSTSQNQLVCGGWMGAKFFSLTSHEEGELFFIFSTFQTFQESWAIRELLTRSTTNKSSKFPVGFWGSFIRCLVLFVAAGVNKRHLALRFINFLFIFAVSFGASAHTCSWARHFYGFYCLGKVCVFFQRSIEVVYFLLMEVYLWACQLLWAPCLLIANRSK